MRVGTSYLFPGQLPGDLPQHKLPSSRVRVVLVGPRWSSGEGEEPVQAEAFLGLFEERYDQGFIDLLVGVTSYQHEIQSVSHQTHHILPTVELQDVEARESVVCNVLTLPW